ncbi:MAG: SET domain-containing protein-lysine N-methyltransferase [Planctomycetota bacterium]
MSESLRDARRDVFVVRESPIHGRGLFAAQHINAHRLIGKYEGPRTRVDGPWVLWIEEGRRAWGIDGQNELRFVNHSAQPNATFRGVRLWSIREILPGEEITHHYGDDWE